MRENIGLFKAKDIKTREWVYGYLNGFCYIESERYIKTGYNEQHEIDPETICEYTGLLDRHGNKIWENDIVEFGQNTYQIVFEAGSFALYDKNGLMVSKIGGFNDHFYSLLPLYIDCDWSENYASDIEITGNRFENK